MIRGVFEGVRPVAVTRVDTRFRALAGGGGDASGGDAAVPATRVLSVDSLIGRDAHVAFLESEAFADALALLLCVGGGEGGGGGATLPPPLWG